MSKRPWAALVLWALLACLAFAGPTSGRVVGVQDGDSVTVKIGAKLVKVRIDGIDAPESAQPFGAESAKWLAKKIRGKVVQVRQLDIDKYGRSVCRLKLAGADISVLSVRSGMSWWYRKYAVADRALRRAEDAAKKRRLGLWAAKSRPIAPWVWRHGGAVAYARALRKGGK